MKQNFTPNTATAGTDPATVSPQQRAAALIAAIDALAAELPAYLKMPLNSIRAHRTVPTDFMSSVVALAEQYEDVRDVAALDTAATSERLELMTAYRPALVRAIKFAGELQTMLDSIRAKVAYDSLDAYAAIKRLSGRAGSNQHAFKTLEKELKRKRRVKEPDDPAQTPSKTTGSSPGVTPPLPPSAQTPATQKTEVSTTK